MKKILIILSLFIFNMLSAFSIEEKSSPKLYYLNDCIEEALKNSPVIKKAKHNLEIAKSDVKISKSEYFPTIGVGLHYFQYVNSDNTYDDAYSKRLLPDFNIYLQQLIFDFGKTSANIDMRKFYEIAAKYQYDNIVDNTISDIKIAYFTALEAKAVVEIEQNNLSINEKIVEHTKKLFELNKKSETDYIDAKVHLVEAKMGLTDAINAYNIALVDLLNKMYIDEEEIEIKNINEFFYVDAYFMPEFVTKQNGAYVYTRPKNMQANIGVNFDGQIRPLPFTLEEARESAYLNNSELKALENTLNAMKKYALTVKREYYPTLKTKVGYNRDDKYMAQKDAIHNNQLNIAVTLDSSINIMKKKNEFDKVNAMIEVAQNSVDTYKKNIYYDIKKYYYDVECAQKQIKNAKEKIERAIESLSSTKDDYFAEDGLNKIGYLELQNARINYNTSKLRYVSELHKFNDALAKLEKATRIQTHKKNDNYEEQGAKQIKNADEI